METIKKGKEMDAKITRCWRTSDGEVFDTEDEALEHDLGLQRCSRISDILSHPQTYPLDRTEHENALITDFLMGNWETLKTLFMDW